ncbi:MAG: pyridoxamine 5'-phosphate oxidase family protein [Chloroflexota bacterium]
MKSLTNQLIRFIEAQKMFFVATAAPDGRVNVSPKGLDDTLKVLDNKRIVWLNLSGSGNETAAHIYEQNRITLMFCAFEGSAMILRIYGQANIIHPRDEAWPDLISLFPELPGSRQIFDITIESAQTSCGSGVPFYEFKGDRGLAELLPFYEDMGTDGVTAYWQKKNQTSIDGKPTHIFA